MTYTAAVDQLRDAVESGDVLELEEAIDRARGVTSRHSPSFTALYLKAQDTFARHMHECRRYLKPLRDACASLSEPAIFQALLAVQDAPEHVQLMMYSDVRNAEDLREDILATQGEVLHVLDCTDWRAVDRFLKQSAAVLDDRSVLALVQHREDLIKFPKTGMARASRQGQPANLIPFLNSVKSTKARAAASPLTAELLAEEQRRRERLCETEHTARVRIYTAALLSSTILPPEEEQGPDGDTNGLFPTVADLTFFPLSEDVRSLWWTQPPPSPLLAAPAADKSHFDAAEREPDPVPRRTAPAPQSLNSSAAAGSTPVLTRDVTRARPTSTPITTTATILDFNTDDKRASTQSRLHSLNLSPIPRATHSSAAPPPAGGSTNRSHVAALLRTPRGGDATGASPIHRPPMPATSTSLSGQRDDNALPMSVGAQRVAARLRAVVRDEDVRRRDIEGTEDFDRSVFLMPMSARIELMRRAQQQRSIALRLY